MDWKQSISILFTGEVSPDTPSVGFASEDLHLVSAPLCCQVADKQCDRFAEVHFTVHLCNTKCLKTNAIVSQRCTAGK